MRLESTPEIRPASLLVQDYLYRFPLLSECFAYNPYCSESYHERYRHLIGERQFQRGVLADALLDFNRAVGSGQKALSNIEALRRPDSVVVTTGQQAGIFTGPLYTIHKAIGAIQLSRRLESQLGCPVIPVFWIASEDHDFDEVAFAEILTSDWELARLALEWRPEGKCSIGQMPLPALEAGNLIRRLGDLTQETDCKPTVMEALTREAGSSRSLVEWFARLMAWLFRDHGLVLLDPMDHRVRQLEKEVFAAAIRRSADVNQALHHVSDWLRDRGYPVTVQKEEDAVHLFKYEDGQRLPLRRAGDRFSVHGGTKLYSSDEMTSLALERPESFSPNVILRPVTQEAILPAIACLGGPGEIAYWVLCRGVFEVFGFRLPVLFPRPNVTLVDPAIERYLEKQGLSVSDVILRLDDKRRELLEREDRLGLDRLFEDFRRESLGRYQEIIDTLAQHLDRGLAGIGQENLRQISAQVNRLQEKARQQHRKNCETGLRQFDRMAVALCPGGVWQERAHNIFPYLIKFGTDLIGLLIDLPLLETRDHQMVFLDHPKERGAS